MASMTKEQYIAWVAPRIVLDSLNRNLLPSFRIAQACFEPSYGTSELAVNANALFGVKNNDQWEGKCYSKLTKECYDGVTLEDVNGDFRAYDSWEESIIDQGDYLINRCVSMKYHPEIKHYAALVGNRDYKDCARILKKKNYGTAHDYDKRVIDYVEKHDLTKYDSMTREEALALIGEGDDTTMANTPIIALDAGHGMYTSGKRCLKSIDPNQTREWYLNDRIMDRVQKLLAGYQCRTIRVDDTTGAKDISLANRVKTANEAGADAYISMHHNADIKGGTGGGTIVFYYSNSAVRRNQASALYNAIVNRTGLVGNRSQKVIKKAFHVLKNTKMPAFLVENGFMDSQTDTPIILTAGHAEKTAQGVVSFLVNQFDLKKKTSAGNPSQATTKPSTSTATTTTITHPVSKGDTLSKIGSKYGVDWKQIAVANNIDDPFIIKPGQVLKIPGAKATSYYPAYKGKSTILITALTDLGINSTYAFRKKIAAANGITGYIGSAAQNTRIYNLLKAGLLKKA